jgi:hypothetical protein
MAQEASERSKKEVVRAEYRVGKRLEHDHLERITALSR